MSGAADLTASQNNVSRGFPYVEAPFKWMHRIPRVR
jgi:hypothetical protein